MTKKNSAQKDAKQFDANTNIIANLPANNEMPVRSSGTSLHKLDRLNKKKAAKTQETPQRGNIPATYTYEQDSITVTTSRELMFDEKTDKLLNLVLIKYAAEPSNDTINFSLAEYMKLTNIKQRKTARLQLARAVDQLTGFKVNRSNLNDLSTKQMKTEPFYDGVVLFERGNYKNGKGFLVLTNTFRKRIAKYTQPMIYPEKLFQLTGTAYYVYDALIYNMQVNYFHNSWRKNSMKLGTLLKACTLPSWQKVKKGNRNYTDRIIAPLGDALEALKSEISYHFEKAGSHKKINSIFKLPTDESFLECYVVVDEWKKISDEQIRRLKARRRKTKANKKVL